MVVDGKTEDKPEVGLRVEWAGLGINLSTAPTSPARLREAVQQVLLNPRYREQARRFAAQAALQDSATIGAQVLELERARSVPAVEVENHAAA
jgi:UDP:flavonoid glycosyltransferase YjiC (YdhE family)